MTTSTRTSRLGGTAWIALFTGALAAAWLRELWPAFAGLLTFVALAVVAGRNTR